MPTGWDETQLADLEKLLMQHIGPVGKVLVRRAARGHTDLAEVRDHVAHGIVDRELRERFIAASTPLVGHAPALATQQRTRPFAETLPVGGHENEPLHADDPDKAAAVMAASLGPIARVLAKKSATRSTTREQFVADILSNLHAGRRREAAGDRPVARARLISRSADDRAAPRQTPRRQRTRASHRARSTRMG